jgi:hypothetical protein
MHPTTKRFRWFAGAAVAVAALATAGLVPAASAQTAAPAGPAAVAALSPSTCRWEPTPANLWVTDPVNSPVGLIGGIYGSPGSRGVAYKVTGQFTHTTTMSFTAYDNLVNIPAANYVINDSQIIPDPGSVNPFVPGNRVEATPRNYTVWFWPDSIKVPTGLKNVVLYPTKPAPGTKIARWSIAMRQYKTQPGYTQLQGLRETKITAVSAANPSKPVRCPLTVAGTFALQVRSFYAHIKKYGKLPIAPEPTTGNKIYFTAFPAVYFLGLDGFAPLPQGCANYLVATVPVNEISVTTMHAVPEFFNNDLVTPASIMKDYPIRYQSITNSYFTPNQRLYRSLFVNTDNARYTSDGSWVVIWLPSQPRLTPEQIALVRAVARALHYNVIQLAPKAVGPLARQVPPGNIALRQKGISASFPYSNKAVPCWSEHHPYTTYPQQTSPAFFAHYASSPANNGPYYLDGFKLTFAQFMAKYSKK